MSNVNELITRPVSMAADVREVLTEASTKASVLCTSSKINKWAKYKPVKYDKYAALTEAERKSVQYGIMNIPRFGNPAYMAMFMYNGTPAPNLSIGDDISLGYWGYRRPGTGDPKRIGDFNGYYHNAMAPINPITANEIIINHDTGDESSEWIHFDFPVRTEDWALKISDFDFAQLNSPSTAGAPFYFGVCITDGVGSGSNMDDYTGTRLMTQSTQINSADGSMTTVTVGGSKCVRVSMRYTDFMAKVPPSGQVMVFAFVSNYIINWGGPSSYGGTLIPFTMSGKMITLITGNVFQVTWGAISATKQSGGGSTGTLRGTITARVNIKNQTNMSQYAAGGTVTLYNQYGTSQQTQPLFPITVTIEAGKTYEAMVTFQVTAFGSYYAKLSWDPHSKESHDMTSPSVTLS